MAWSRRPEIVLPLATLAVLYGAGWIRLSHRAPGIGAGLVGRLVLAYGALAALAVALLSPLHDLAYARFSAHMLQHMLLVAVAAPLLLLADPFPVLLWALPARARAAAGRLVVAGAPARSVWRFLTRMPTAWLAHVLVLWLWHLPALYDAALSRHHLHDLQHLTFFASATLFWCPVVDPAPRVAPPAHPGWRIAYLLLAAFQGGALGLLLASRPTVLYAAYARGGAAALDDQAWGGIIMWALGGAVEMIAVLTLVFAYLAREERVHSLTVSRH